MMGIGNLFDRTIAAFLPITPRFIVKRVAARYVAGESLDEALPVMRRIQEAGACATLDVLGEEIHDISEGAEAVQAYRDCLDLIAREKLDANISIKLTAFGLRQDAEITYERVREIVAHAASLENFVRIDMEDSSTTDATLDLYRRLRAEGFDNVGVVLQAYMRRTQSDVAALAELKTNYRLCKGIYVEREEVAFKDGAEINQNYLESLEAMFDADSYVGIATHDHALVDGAEAILKRRSLAKDAYEFQMLLGVDPRLGKRLVEEDHRLRVYVPFGRDWYAYCVRRLKENPKIGRYVFLALFKRS
jgi:proline dehydrogenase